MVKKQKKKKKKDHHVYILSECLEMYVAGC